jgi:ATP-dependent Clp protease ATP-binding subunit ClpB
VFNVLLQVLDDGRLTDGQGRTVDFRNTDHRADLEPRQRYPGGAAGWGGSGAGLQGRDGRGARRISGRNSSNRLDETVLFRRLQRSDMAAIVDIQLARLRALLADRKMALELDGDGGRMARQRGL